MADIDNLTIQITAEASTAINAFEKLIDVMKAVNAELDRLDPSKTKGFSSAAETVNKAFSSIAESATKVKEITKTLDEAGQSAGMEKVNNAAQGVKKELDDLSNSANIAAGALRNVGGSAISVGLGGFRSFVNNVKMLGHALSGSSTYLTMFGKLARGIFSTITAPAKAAAKAMRSLGNTNNFTAKTATKLAKELTRVGKMLKLMVTRMALRAVIKEVGNGFKSLALHSEQFNQSVSGMINGAKKLGYSFSAMVSPLINALAPAIQYVINLLVKLMNAINQVFSALTGATTFNKSKDFAEDWASNIKAANKEAKQLKKTVLGFDELNQLQERQTSGGDTSGNIVDMFETAEIDPKWKKFAKWLKDMWDMGDFTELGKEIGKKLRDFLESIPWEQIRKTANKLGGAFATLINGFVEVERLGYDIGKTIAQSVNTVFEFLNGFVHKLHWDSIGKFIGETFNGFFENIDWELIKDTCVTGMAGIAEAIQNFIDTFNWDNISEFIINAVDTITESVKSFFEGIDWLDLGQKMGEQLKKTIEGIDAEEIGVAIGDVLQAGIDWVTGVLDTLPSAETLVQKATEFLQGLFDTVDSKQLGEDVAELLNYTYDVLVGFWDENGDAIKEEVKKFFEGFWDKIDKEDLKNVLKGILEVVIIGGIASISWEFLKAYLAAKFSSLIFNNTILKSIGTACKGLYYAIIADEGFVSLGYLLSNPASVIALSKLIDFIRGTWLDPDEWSNLFGQMYDYFGIAYNNLIAWGMLLITGWEDIFKGNPIGTANKEAGFEWQSFDKYNKAIEILEKNGKDTGGTYEDLIRRANLLKEEQTTGLGIAAGAAAAFKTNIDGLQADYDNLNVSAKEYTETAAKGVDEIAPKFDKINASLGDVGKTTPVLTEKQKRLDETLKNVGEKVKTNSDNHKVLAGVMGDLGKQTGNITTETDKAKTSLGNLKGAVDQNIQVAPVFNKAQKDIESALDGVIDQTNNLGTTNTVVWGDVENEVAYASGVFGENVYQIQECVKDGADEIQKQTDNIGKAFTKDKWTFDGVTEGLKSTFSSAIEGVKGLWNKFADKMNEGGEVGSERFKIKLPRFASGGFPENGLFLANSSELVGRFSNGKTAVANNNQIVDGIAAGVYNAVSSALASSNANNNGGYIANTIVVDGEVIARTVTKAQQKQQMRFSPQMG